MKCSICSKREMCRDLVETMLLKTCWEESCIKQAIQTLQRQRDAAVSLLRNLEGTLSIPIGLRSVITDADINRARKDFSNAQG